MRSSSALTDRGHAEDFEDLGPRRLGGPVAEGRQQGVERRGLRPLDEQVGGERRL